jgi:hypothetical protein
MNRHADDRPPVSPPFVQAGRRLAHWAPRSAARAAFRRTHLSWLRADNRSANVCR